MTEKLPDWVHEIEGAKEKPEKKPIKKEESVEHPSPVKYELPEEKKAKGSKKDEEDFEEAEFTKPFNYEEALNNKEFVEFLELHPEDQQVELTGENIDELADRWEAFENKNFLNKELLGLYKKELEPAFDFKLNKDQENLVGDYLKKEAVREPEALGDRVQEFRVYEDLKKEKENLEKQISDLGGEANREAVINKVALKEAELSKERSVAKWATGWRGFLNPKNSELLGWAFRIPETLLWKNDLGMDLHQVRKKARGFGKKGGIMKKLFGAGKAERAPFFAQLDEQMATMMKGEWFLKKYPDIKERTDFILNELKKKFFENFEPARKIFEGIREETIKQMADFVGEQAVDPDETVYDRLQEFKEKIEKGKAKFDSEELAGLPLEAFQEEIDERVGLAVTANISAVVENFKIGNKPLEDLRSQLKSFLEREKLGSKDKTKTKLLIGNIIKENVAELMVEKPEGYKQKVMLLKVIAADLAYNG